MTRKFLLQKKNLKSKDKAILSHIRYLQRCYHLDEDCPEETHCHKRGRGWIIESFYRERVEPDHYDYDADPIYFQFGRITDSSKYQTIWKKGNIQHKHIILIEDGVRFRKSEQYEESDYRDPDDY